MRTRPTLSGRRPIVAASTRLARSGSSRYTEQTSVANRRWIRCTMFVSVSEAFPLCDTSRLISSSVQRKEPSWVVATSVLTFLVGRCPGIEQEDCLQRGENCSKKGDVGSTSPNIVVGGMRFFLQRC